MSLGGIIMGVGHTHTRNFILKKLARKTGELEGEGEKPKKPTVFRVIFLTNQITIRIKLL